ncbi:MAG: hypothetical protein AAB354_17220 [candidate division KSB1 bacterium]
MNCETAQAQLFEAPRGAELETHLAACEACRKFARVLLAFENPIAPPPLPVTLHDQVLRQSYAIIRASRSVRTHAPGNATRGQANGFALATVMILYVTGLSLTLSQLSFGSPWPALAGIFLMQNLIALCFSPLLFARFHLLRIRTVY